MDAPALDAPAADWLVYGDSLQTKGDPRGALIAISLAIAEGTADESARDAYLAEHAAALLGDAAPFVATYRFDWTCALPTGVRVRLGANDGDHRLAILGSVLGAGLREIALVGHSTGRTPVGLGAAMTALLARRPAGLVRFAFIDERAENAHMLISRDFEPRDNLVSFGSFAPFFAIAEEIRIDVADSHQLDLSPIAGPELRAFTLNSLRFADYDDPGPMIARLEDSDLPKLERFRVRLTETWFANIPAEDNPYLPVYSERYTEETDEDGEPVENRYEEEADFGDNNGANWEVLGDLLRALSKVPLRELALTGFDSSRPLIEALDAGGFAPTLETLDLSDSGLNDDDCAWIVAHPARFGTLKRIVAERTQMTESGAATLKKLGVEVVAGGERVTYRYVVGSE